MKSIMEEASTITKAIENAWNRAGQPQEFTVKILELPKTSFFGLKTSKSAKIALIFNELTVKIKEQPQKQVRPTASRPHHDRRDQRDHRDQHGERPQQPQRRPLPSRDAQRDHKDQRDAQQPQPRTERPHDGRQPSRHEPRDQRRPQGPRQPYRSEGQSSNESRSQEPRHHEQRAQERETWAPEMVDAAQDWIKETLVMMGKPEIKINAHVSHNYLKLYLDQPVMDDFKQEETQLKSWGSLAMEAVREKANKPLRSLRIILESKK